MKPVVVIDEAAKAALEEQHLQVQKSIEALPPEQQQTIRGLQKLVDYELEQNNQIFFNDKMFAVDEFLVKNGLPGNCKDDLMRLIQKTQKGCVFVFQGKSFIKTYNDLIFNTQDYIKSLEMTIADQVVYKEVVYKVYKTAKKGKSSGKQKK